MWLANASKADADKIIKTWPTLEIGKPKPEIGDDLVGIYSDEELPQKVSDASLNR